MGNDNLGFPSEPPSDNSDIWLGLLFVILFLAWVAYRSKQKQQEQLSKEKGIIERYKLIFINMNRFAPDARVLRDRPTILEMVGTLNGLKTYVHLQHITIIKPTIKLTVTVVTNRETRKRFHVFTEPVEPETIWQEIQIEAEKLADGA